MHYLFGNPRFSGVFPFYKTKRDEIMTKNNPRKTITQLMQCSVNELRDRFCVKRPTEGCYRFEEIENSKHFVLVSVKKTDDPFSALVDADFDFDRMAGSNNYPQLLDLGRKLADAFDLPIYW